MNKIIDISEQAGILGTHRLTVKNIITGKVIQNCNVNPEYVDAYKTRATIDQTAKFIQEQIKARYNNYKHSDYFRNDPDSWSRKMKIFDTLVIQSSQLSAFTTVEAQTKFIQRVILPLLEIVAPKNERFHAFPAMIQAFKPEADKRQLQIEI